MALHVKQRARAISCWRRRMACQAFGALAVLSAWAVESPAASLHSPDARRLPPPPVQHGVGRRRLPKPPSVEPGLRRKLSVPPTAVRGTPEGELPRSIAVVIDGFVASLEAAEELFAELRPHGEVLEKRFFAEPRRLESVRCKSGLDSDNIEFVPVARGIRTADAISGEVRKLLQARRIGAVALLVSTYPLYANLVEEIVAAGRRCFMKFSARHVPTPRIQLFERAGAHILACETVQSKKPLGKYMCILHNNGTGCVKKISDMPSVSLPSSDQANQDCTDYLASRLCELGYQSSTGDPLIPSISKFWFNNGLGELIVHPDDCAILSLAEVFRERPNAKWVSGCRDLAFILPRTLVKKTATTLNEYGSVTCAIFAKAGVGPMVLRDSSTMVEDMLRKLGFLSDGDSSESFEEALDVFAGLSLNARAMRAIDLQFVEADTACEKADKIRRLCLSDSCFGHFQMAPSDMGVREFLVKKRLLNSTRAPSKEVFFAMASFASSAGLVPKRTHGGRVIQCLDIFSSRLRQPTKWQ